MSYPAHVCNGVVVLDEPASLPEGAEVRVERVNGQGRKKPTEEEIPSLYERFKHWIGTGEGLPPDMSVNLDHYLYGTPKKP